MHIAMIASENGALPGGKVGGIGDVIRDVPRELAAQGHRVTVINPGYQFLSRLPGARLINTLTVDFASALERIAILEVELDETPPGVRMVLLDHPLFGSAGESTIYHHDAHEPFATDARTFALFCHALCLALVSGALPRPDVLHLHDWHAAMLLVLRQSHPAYRILQSVPCVFTIHNLSLQGIRPLAGNWSSPGAWFPALRLPLQDIVDPRYRDCINLMRAGIRLADKVHVVSPTYAREIQLPSDEDHGLIRGEGLQNDLQQAAQQGRLFGILNGCEYPTGRPRAIAYRQFMEAAVEALDGWVGNKLWIKASLFKALQRLDAWHAGTRKPPMVVASIGRITAQKMRLLAVPTRDGRSALDAMLAQLDDGIMIVLGSGDEGYEHFLLEVMQRHANFLFLNGFSESLADLLYRYCDLFLMPSSFEPCGISQMLAMRAGAPCLVHKVGGLADTVCHLENGFCFEGEDLQAQVAAMLQVFSEVQQLRSGRPPLWNKICRNAAAARFSWEGVVRDYVDKLYR
ncbi:MAG: glycogen synthase [Pseudohongiellaceae bacterium]